MKMFIIMTLAFTLQATASVYSQNTRITLNYEQARLGDVLSRIEKDTEFVFFYRHGAIDQNVKVDIHASNKNINDVLNDMFRGTGIEWTVKDRLIILGKKETNDVAILQGITISGTVTDAAGETLPGVNVVVKGTTTGVVTDLDGKYSINVPNADAVLQFSFVGYITQEIAVSNQTIIMVTLNEDVAQIDEVIVVGYGTQKKVTLTGSVSQVSGDDIVSRPSTSVANALQGMMPGVEIMRSSGQPGSENSGLRIRGLTSVNPVDALVLIDGMEGNLTTLNPDDIESISVLKDASSASIYGARAAGGVVLVTTKKGSTQKMNITYNGSFGINVPGIMPQRVPGWEEQDMIAAARFVLNGAIEKEVDEAEWIANPNYNYDLHTTTTWNRYQSTANTNWIAEGLRKYTTTQHHAISVNGGHGKTNYFLSGGYYTQKGLFKFGPDSNDRYNMRVNLNTEMNKYLDFKLSVAYEDNITYRNSVGHEGIMSRLYSNRAREILYLPEDDINYEKDPYGNDLHSNPIRAMKYAGSNTEQRNYFNGAGILRVKNIVEGLTIDLSASSRFGVYSRESDNHFLGGQGRNAYLAVGNENDTYGFDSYVIKVKNNSRQDKLEALVNYSIKFDKHSIALLGGASYEHFLRDEINVTAKTLLSEELFSFGFYDSEGQAPALADQINEWKMASIFGRINYSYDNRYLLEFVARRDGSSRLAPGNRFGFFPGVSAGWIISEESFFSGITDYVSFMKLRGSYGSVGNSTVLNSMYYPYIGTVDRRNESNGAPTLYMGKIMYYRKEMPSVDITWETVTTANIAVDMSFLKRRLSLTAEYFWKKNKDMLSQAAPGNILGIETVPNENVGTMKVWGWELSVGWRDRIGDLHYNVSFNMDDSRNKLIEYKGISTIGAGTTRLLEGYPLNTLWGYQTDGFWNSRQEYLDYKAAHPGYSTWQDAKLDGGDTHYVAQGAPDHAVGSTGGGTPDDPGDLVHLGDASPRYAYGINLGVQWKGIDFSCFFQGVGKRSTFIQNTAFMPLGGSGTMPWTIHRDYWREDNKGAYFARLWEANTNSDSGLGNYQYADRWVQNAAYIRLKTIQLGYTIPVSKYVQSLRIYVSGNDVWEHTKMLKAFDPEFVNMVDTRTSENNVTNRVSRNYYPFMRTWTAGVNVTF